MKKPFLIAEIGINHNGNIKLAKKLIDIAKEAKFNAVKFQKRNINEVYSEEELKAIQEQIERDKENTTLARFIRNLESRIYAQLSRQLVENLFGETPSTEGTLTLEGNTIEYSIDNGIITLKITDADGNITEIQLPIGDFSF